MLAEKFLTEELRQLLNETCESCGFTLEDILRSGVENTDSNIGAYAGDAACYKKFSPLFNPIIENYHNFPLNAAHRKDLTKIDPALLPDLDPHGTRIVSTRIRVARNLEGFTFPPAISRTSRLELEQSILKGLKNLKGELAGTYYPLSEMDEATQNRLTLEHFLFKKGDRFLESAGVNRDWPSSRGIFISADKKFLVWVNEEDHLRIISMQRGGDLRAVFERLCQAIALLGEELEFAFDKHLGYLTSCPTNLGTALRASMHVKLPELSQRNDFIKLCEDLRLSVRGVHGEHSESESGVYDISNKQRLGVTEVECIKTLHAGVAELLLLEDKIKTES